MKRLLTIIMVAAGFAGICAPGASAHQAASSHHCTRSDAQRTHRSGCTLRHATRHHSSGPLAHSAASNRSSLLDTNFSCGCINKKMFPYSSFVPNHASVVPDPLGSGKNVLKFSVNDSDRPYGADNPRADVEGPHMFKPGDNDYVAFHVMVPTTMPPVDTDKAWFELAEIYGQPYNGSPTVDLKLSDYGENGVNHFTMDQDANHNWARAWTGPAANDGKWHTIVYHVNFETNNTGSVQIYLDGQLQTLTNNTTILHEATLDPGVNWDGTDGNFVNLQSYRLAGAFPGTVTTYERGVQVGKTLASVE